LVAEAEERGYARTEDGPGARPGRRSVILFGLKFSLIIHSINIPMLKNGIERR
jgi:hypothetical protein